MSRPILSRPRTRVYGCNYDKGESYYKPMVDHLDRKYSGRPLFSEPRNSIADEIAARRSDIGSRDLGGPRIGPHGRDLDPELDPRITRTSQLPPSPLTDPLLLLDDEDTVFDSRGQRTRRRLADDFASEVASTTRRIKQRVAQIGLEEELETRGGSRGWADQDLLDGTLNARRNLQSAVRSALEETDAGSAFKRRSKLLADELDQEDIRPGSTLTRWSKLLNADDGDAVLACSAAASRAKQTKARLSDLESEMEELAERQAKRERRAAALRALVNENALAAEESLQSTVSSKKVSMRSVQGTERAEKHVTF